MQGPPGGGRSQLPQRRDLLHCLRAAAALSSVGETPRAPRALVWLELDRAAGGEGGRQGWRLSPAGEKRTRRRRRRRQQ